MFSLDELPHDVAPGPSPSEIRHFGAEDFAIPGSEQDIVLVRALKVSYENAIAFWKAAEACVGDLALPVGVTSQSLTEAAALETISSRLRGLRRPFVFELRSAFLASQMLSEEGDWYVSVFVETALEYIAFRWYSTA